MEFTHFVGPTKLDRGQQSGLCDRGHRAVSLHRGCVLVSISLIIHITRWNIYAVVVEVERHQGFTILHLQVNFFM